MYYVYIFVFGDMDIGIIGLWLNIKYFKTYYFKIFSLVYVRDNADSGL